MATVLSALMQPISEITQYTFQHVRNNFGYFLQNKKVCGVMFKNLDDPHKKKSQGNKCASNGMSPRIEVDGCSENGLRPRTEAALSYFLIRFSTERYKTEIAAISAFAKSISTFLRHFSLPNAPQKGIVCTLHNIIVFSIKQNSKIIFLYL